MLERDLFSLAGKLGVSKDKLVRELSRFDISSMQVKQYSFEKAENFQYNFNATDDQIRLLFDNDGADTEVYEEYPWFSGAAVCIEASNGFHTIKLELEQWDLAEGLCEISEGFSIHKILLHGKDVADRTNTRAIMKFKRAGLVIVSIEDRVIFTLILGSPAAQFENTGFFKTGDCNELL